MSGEAVREREIQGVRLRVRSAEALAAQAGDVLESFARQYGEAGRLDEGSQIRFGWSLLRVVRGGDGLWVAEPEFARWPEQVWVPRIDTTLEVLSAQVRLLKRVRVKGEDACFDQVVFAARGALDAPEVFLRRTASRSDVDSGWVLGSLANPEALAEEEGLEAVTLARLVERHRYLLQVLALPSDFIAVFKEGKLDQIFDGTGKDVL